MASGWRAFPHRGDRPLGPVVAAVQPLLLVGTAAAVAHLDAFVPGTAADVASGVLVVVLVLMWLASVVSDVQPFLWFLGMIAAIVAVTTVTGAATENALHERGERTSCAVATIVERTGYSAHVRPGGSPAQGPFPAPPAPPAPNPGSDQFDRFDTPTPRTSYDYGLTCESGPVTTARWTERPAEVGGRLQVVYDPLGLVGPVPAAGRTDTDGSAEYAAAAVATLVAAVLRAVGTLRPPWGRRRRRWRRGAAR